MHSVVPSGRQDDAHAFSQCSSDVVVESVVASEEPSFTDGMSIHNGIAQKPVLPNNGIAQKPVLPRRVTLNEMPMMGTCSFLDSTNSKSPKQEHTVLPSGPMFVNTEAMKKQLREKMYKKPYNVFDFYKEHGICQAIAKNWYFENLTLLVILFNAIWIWIDTDYNNADVLWESHPIFQIAEHSLCAYYSFEWLVRFGSFACKRNCLKDAWFMFDSILVGVSVLETWVVNFIMMAMGGGGGSDSGMGSTVILRMARLLRLSRMARMARLFRIMPELMILIKGMIAACRSVLFTMALLLILMYVFAIVFTQLTENTNMGQTYFNSVPESMVSLLLFGTLLDNVGDVAKEIGADGLFYAILFMAFVLLAALTVMNMLIGILCEVVSSVANVEKEEMVISFVKNKMQQVLDSGIDEDNDHMISKHEFLGLLDNESAMACLQEVGVDVFALPDFADFIFECDVSSEEKELNFPDFMEVMLQLRGTNRATVKDIVDLRKYLRGKHREVLKIIQDSNKHQRRLMEKVDTGRISCSRNSSSHMSSSSRSKTIELSRASTHTVPGIPYDEVQSLHLQHLTDSEHDPESTPEVNDQALHNRMDALTRLLKNAAQEMGELHNSQENVERITEDASSELLLLREIVTKRGRDY